MKSGEVHYTSSHYPLSSVNQKKGPCDEFAVDLKDKFRDETAYHRQNFVYCDNSHHT